MVKPATLWPVKKRHHNRPRISRPAPPPVALALVAASYDPNVSVTLVFNAPIDISQIVPDMISVADGEEEGVILIGMASPTLTNPTTVVVMVEPFDPYQGSGISLTASDGAGIRSMTGEEWEGVDGLELPYGQ